MLEPNITRGQIAIDPINGVFFYKDESGTLVKTTLSWLQDTYTSISTEDSATFDNDVTISGNLTVNGDTVSVNVAQVLVEDNFLILNSNVSSAPSLNAGIEVERGTSTNVSIRWNETTDKWQVTEDGTNYYDILSTNTASVVTLTGTQTLTNKTLTDPIITGISPTITLAGDLSGSVALTNLGDATLTATVINNSVALGTDTTGDYVSKLAAGTGITITNNSGESATPNISFSGSINDLSDLTITSAQNGQILEYDGSAWVNTVRPSSEPIGHENKADSVISFNESSREFSIAPASTSYTVWCTGKRYVKTSTETVTIPDTSGLYYIYFNSSGSLAYKTTFFTWDQDTPTAYVYWNENDNKAYFFADERHGVTLDWATHEYLHRTRGAAIANGFGANNYTLVGDGSLDAHAKIDIANGTFFDEDLQVDIEHAASPTANTWQQRLQSGAYIPVFYRLNTHWTKDVATQFPVKNGGTRAQFNLNTAGTWSSTAIDNSKFGVMFVVATNNLNEPIISIMGQSQYTDQGSAEAAAWDELDLAGFPIVEFRPLYKIVFQTATAYTNSPKTRFVNLIDLRTVLPSGDGLLSVPVSDHGNMTGLSDDDHTQYLNDTRHDALDHSTAMSSVILDNISDVEAATPSDDQVLTWDSATSKWTAQTFSATVAGLDNIGDVTAPSPSSGDYLKWNGSAWINDPINLGTDTVGNYMSDITAGTGVSVTHTPGEGSSGSISIGQSVGTSDSVTFNNISLNQNGSIIFEGSTGDSYETTLTVIDPTADHTVSLPNASDTLVGKATTDTFTNKTFDTAGTGNSFSINGNAISTVTGSGSAVLATSPSISGVTLSGTTTISGQLDVQQIREKVNTSAISGNLMICDYSTGAIFDQTTKPNANFTVNFTNVPTDNNYVASFTIMVTQGTTWGYPNAAQVAGSSVTIKWPNGNTAPAAYTSPDGKIDIFTFTLLRTGSAWTVFGSYNLNY